MVSLVLRYTWILHGRSVVCKTVGRFLICRRKSMEPCSWQMASFPVKLALSTGHAVVCSEVVFSELLCVRRSKSEGKVCRCLYVPLTYREIHIKVTHSRSTDAFTKALGKFVARCGQRRTVIKAVTSNILIMNYKLAFAGYRNQI